MSTRSAAPWLVCEQRPFLWWNDVWWISNGIVEAAVPTSFGPRLMSFGRAGGPNLFRVPSTAPGPNERVKGGHRLWVAPEREEVTWVADNEPVEITFDEGTVDIRGQVESQTGLRKSMRI